MYKTKLCLLLKGDFADTGKLEHNFTMSINCRFYHQIGTVMFVNHFALCWYEYVYKF